MVATSSSSAPHQRPKLAQIAKMANTTTSTVSKAINGRAGVSDETRQRIEKILNDLEYTKRPVQHALSTSITLVFDSMANPWVLDIMQGATDAAIARGLSVTVCAKHSSDGESDDSYRQAIRRARPQAVIFDNAYVSMKDRTLCQELGVRFAVIDPSGRPARDCAEVRIDNWTGGFEAGCHLLGLGHRRFAVICGPSSSTCFPARLDGFRSALAQEDIILEDDMIRIGDFWSESARLHALELLSRENRPTAIFACSDTHALGIYDAAHQLGLHIPEDLSIIGFDDIESARHLNPPLTTMRQPMAEMTRSALSTLLASKDTDTTGKLLFPPTLIARGSTSAHATCQ